MFCVTLAIQNRNYNTQCESKIFQLNFDELRQERGKNFATVHEIKFIAWNIIASARAASAAPAAYR